MHPKRGTQEKERPKGKQPTTREQQKTKSKKNREKERNKERKKESGKKKRENTVGIGVCINKLSFPSLLANSLFKVPKSNS